MMGALESHVIGYGRRLHQGSGVVWGDGHMIRGTLRWRRTHRCRQSASGID